MQNVMTSVKDICQGGVPYKKNKLNHKTNVMKNEWKGREKESCG